MPEGYHNVSYETPVSLTSCESRCGWRVVGGPKGLPDAGVYAIYRAGSLVYIGSSSQLSVRLQPYFRLRHPDVPLVTVKVAPSRRAGDWLMREYRLIRRLRPADNKTHASDKRARRFQSVRGKALIGDLKPSEAMAESSRMLSAFMRDLQAFYLARHVEGQS